MRGSGWIMNKMPESLMELLDNYTVEIPKIQRDYVQGRKDDDTEIIRQQLLKDMKEAILGNEPPLDLNFVYGKKARETFIPLDGQQRLTTLFLLYLFAFSEDESKDDIFQKFTYETRISSRDFLKCIAKNREEIFTSSITPSAEVKDSPWFLSSWKYDPTIQSALVMMDEIKETFGDVEDLGGKLEADKKPITFRFKDIEELGMEDSLYIKLNARGKMLTPFESFKSQFIGRIDSPDIDLDSKAKDDYKLNFDGEWTDVIWRDSKESREVSFDDSFLNFFEVLFINNGIIQENTLWWSRLDYQSIDLDIFKKVEYLLDFISKDSHDKKYKELIFKPIRNKSQRTYEDQVLFHALTVYLCQCEGLVDQGDLFGWIRIIKNLVLNTRIDRENLFKNAIERIDDLGTEWKDLTDYFAQDDSKISTFNGEQVREEKIKAKIIKKSQSFADKIYKAEENAYFRGQIRAALYLAKKDDIYHECKFMEYWVKIEKLFEKWKGNEDNEKNEKYFNLIRRTMLTYGDYRLTISSVYRTLCVTDPYEYSRTPSLRSLFSQNNKYVIELLDDLDMNKDIISQLEDRVKSANINEDDWRYCIINYPDNIKRMSRRHLRMRESMNGNCIMVPNQMSNGYNYDLYLNTLYLKLKQKYPFLLGEDSWAEIVGTDAKRFFRIKNFDIYFEDGSYVLYNADTHDNLVFRSGKGTPITDTYSHLVNNCLP